MKQIAETGMVAGVHPVRKEEVDRYAALVQAPHEGKLVTETHGEELRPPKLVEPHDRRIKMPAENQIVLH